MIRCAPTFLGQVRISVLPLNVSSATKLLISRVIFPVMFSTFHLMYWTIYMAISGDEIPDEFVPLHKSSH